MGQSSERQQLNLHQGPIWDQDLVLVQGQDSAQDLVVEVSAQDHHFLQDQAVDLTAWAASVQDMAADFLVQDLDPRLELLA